MNRLEATSRIVRVVAAVLLVSLAVVSLHHLKDWRLHRVEASAERADAISALCHDEYCPPRLLNRAETQPGHYWGQARGDATSPPDLWLCYATEGGLLNQHASHINGLAMAIAVGAKGIIMPPMRTRKGWAAVEDTQWEGAPVEGTWDVASWTKYAAERGVTVTTIPATLPFNDVPSNTHQACFGSAHNPHGFKHSQVLKMPKVRLRYMSPVRWGQIVRDQVRDHAVRSAEQDEQRQQAAREAGKKVPRRTPPPRRLLLSLPSTLLALRSRMQPLMTEVAMNLHFSPALRVSAARVAASVNRQFHAQHFNGMHLRAEADAMQVGWFQERGGVDMVWQAYANATVLAGFSKSVPMYVASGIFGDADAADQRQRLARLGGKAASGVCEKTKFLLQKERESLSLGQLAVIDFLVLARAQRLVVFDRSSFSIFLHEFRKLHHLPGQPPICVFGSAPCSQYNITGLLSKGFVFDTFSDGEI
jgi:hypothetical protein